MPTTTNYTWNPLTDSVIEESDGSGNVLCTYTNKSTQYGPLISETRGGIITYYHADAIGSTRLTTNSSQSIIDSFLFDAWGNTMATAGATTTPYQWGGRWGYQTDATSALTYVRERTYHSTIGRWTSIDPLRALAASRRGLVVPSYSYVENNPIKHYDARGLDIGAVWNELMTPIPLQDDPVLGLAQGAANILNGMQHAIIAIPNIVPAAYNSLTGSLYNSWSIFPSPRMPTIPSPDWSNNLLVENDPWHSTGVFIGGQGGITVATLGLSQFQTAAELLHLTSAENAQAILGATMPTIYGNGGVFASSGGRFTTMFASRILRSTTGSVPITSAARPLFAPIPVIGPVSAYNRILMNGYVARSSAVNLTTGAAAPLGTQYLQAQLLDLGVSAGWQLAIQGQMNTLPLLPATSMQGNFIGNGFIMTQPGTNPQTHW